MNLFAHISSLVTLVSLFILGPALGRALLLWWDGAPGKDVTFPAYCSWN
jgi:ABC-type transport system involved in cytochrome c biogenesis permease subunit